jgi:hypothetical protein
MSQKVQIGLEEYDAEVIVKVTNSKGETAEIGTELNPEFALSTVGIYKPKPNTFTPVIGKSGAI